MQMLFGNVNVGAADAAFEMLPKVLHPINVRVALGVFMVAVVNRLVLVAALFQTAIRTKFIGVNRGTLFHVGFDDGLQRGLFAVRNDLRHHLAVALQHAKDNRFVGRATPTNACAMTSDIGFINLDLAGKRKLAVHLCHVLADFVTHAPRRLVSHAKLAFQLFRGNPVAGSGEKVDRIEPRLQRSAAVLEKSPGGRVKVMTAPLASIGALGLETIPVGFLGALRADMALAKAHIKKVVQTGFVIRELREKLGHCRAALGFVLFHAPNLC